MGDNRDPGYQGRNMGGGFGDQRPDVSKTVSQTGHDTDGRSPDYDANRLGDERFFDGRHATDLDMNGNRLAPAADSGAVAGTASHHDRGDNRDGLGRDRTDQVTADETGKLISAEKVIGTAVYNDRGERLGTIHSVMLHKISGRVAYAVMSFGGFLGLGERYHPLPWDVLTYDEEKGGYNVDKTEEQLRQAPHYSRDELEHLNYDEHGGRIRDYYALGASDAYERGRDAGGSAAYGTSMQGTTQPGGTGPTTR